MKNGKYLSRFVFLVLFLSFISQAAFAAVEKTSSEPKRFNVMVNPLGFLFGKASLGFNVGVAERTTLGVAGEYLSFGSFTGGGATLRMNQFLSGPRFGDSWYVAPKITYSAGKLGSQYSANGFDVGVLGGYSWLYDSGFNMMLGAGVAYSTLSLKSGSHLDRYTGTMFIGEFAVGYAW